MASSAPTEKASVTHRREPRVQYRARVRISDPGGERASEATCVDLSAGGMGVSTGRVRAIGTAVMCRLRVGERALELPGVVAWARPPEGPVTRSERPDTKTLLRLGGDDPEPSLPDEDAAPSPSMGIRFEALGVEPARTLEEIMRESEPVRSAVELRFAGLADSVAARAEASAEGLTLHAALPFLELGSEIGVRFGSDSSERRGRVAGVELSASAEQPTPVLRVHVALAVRQPAVPDARVSERTQPERDPAAQRAASVALVVTLIAFASAAAGPVSWLRSGRKARHARATSTQTVPSTAQPLAVPQVPALQPAAATANEPASPVIAPAIATPEPAAPATTASPEPAATLTEAAPIATLDGPRTRLFIPMDGNDTGMRIYELSSPGLVVTLPHARARIPLEDYAIYQGLVRRAWLRPFEEGVQVRVVWRTPAVGHRVQFDEAGLTLIAEQRAHR